MPGLHDHYSLIAGIGPHVPYPALQTEIDPAAIEIDELEMSYRLHGVIARVGCSSLSDIITHDRAWWMAQKNFGAKSLNELLSILDSYGMRLSPE